MLSSNLYPSLLLWCHTHTCIPRLKLLLPRSPVLPLSPYPCVQSNFVSISVPSFSFVSHVSGIPSHSIYLYLGHLSSLFGYLHPFAFVRGESASYSQRPSQTIPLFPLSVVFSSPFFYTSISPLISFPLLALSCSHFSSPPFTLGLCLRLAVPLAMHPLHPTLLTHTDTFLVSILSHSLLALFFSVIGFGSILPPFLLHLLPKSPVQSSPAQSYFIAFLFIFYSRHITTDSKY